MEFQDVVRRRRMVRRFDPDRPVAAEATERMLANATRAPSAGFTQGWAFLVLEEPADRERFWACGDEGPDNAWIAGMRTAPLLVVVLASKEAYLDRYAEPDKGWADRDEARWAVPYWHVDAGMAALLVLQTAVDEGLGACLFSPPERSALAAAFGVPETHEATGVVAVGHPVPGGAKGSPARRPRLPLASLVHRGHWST